MIKNISKKMKRTYVVSLAAAKVSGTVSENKSMVVQWLKARRWTEQ